MRYQNHVRTATRRSCRGFFRIWPGPGFLAKLHLQSRFLIIVIWVKPSFRPFGHLGYAGEESQRKYFLNRASALSWVWNRTSSLMKSSFIPARCGRSGAQFRQRRDIRVDRKILGVAQHPLALRGQHIIGEQHGGIGVFRAFGDHQARHGRWHGLQRLRRHRRALRGTDDRQMQRGGQRHGVFAGDDAVDQGLRAAVEVDHILACGQLLQIGVGLRIAQRQHQVEDEHMRAGIGPHSPGEPVLPFGVQKIVECLGLRAGRDQLGVVGDAVIGEPRRRGQARCVAILRPEFSPLPGTRISAAHSPSPSAAPARFLPARRPRARRRASRLEFSA